MFDSFFNMPPELMTALSTVLGFALLGDLTADEQNSLGNFLMLAAQIIVTNACQKQLLEDLAQNDTLLRLQSELDELKLQLAELRSLG